MQSTAAPAPPIDTHPATEACQVPAEYPLRVEYNDTAREVRDYPDAVEAYHKPRREQYDKRFAAELMCEESKAAAAGVNIDDLRKLDRKALYAGKSLATSDNPRRPFMYVQDSDGRLANVNVAAAMRASDDFLEELGSGSFGYVYRTKPLGDKPSIVKKVYRPIFRHAAAHEFRHLSKFRYFDFCVRTTGRAVSTLFLGDVRCECLELSDNPVLKSLEWQRKRLESIPTFPNPEYEISYTVALADIAIGLQYLHTAGIIHGNLTGSCVS